MYDVMPNLNTDRTQWETKQSRNHIYLFMFQFVGYKNGWRIESLIPEKCIDLGQSVSNEELHKINEETVLQTRSQGKWHPGWLFIFDLIEAATSKAAIRIWREMFYGAHPDNRIDW